jgi:hypothetical protein
VPLRLKWQADRRALSVVRALHILPPASQDTLQLLSVTNTMSMWLLLLTGTSVLPKLCDLGGTPWCVVTPPTPCPSNPLDGQQTRFACSIIDLRISVSASTTAPAVFGKDAEYGLLVRFVVPSNQLSTGTPMLLRFHGTGGCGLDTPAPEASCSCTPDIPCSVADGCKDWYVAAQGVLVVHPAERGSSHCYAPSDPMTSSASWLGDLVYRDYDTLIESVLAGSLHPMLPKNVDPARVGVSGGSHGGLATFMYPPHATQPRSHPFALAMPYEGAPDCASTWFKWQYDSETVASGGSPAQGFVMTAGAHSQVNAWPGSALARLVANAFATGNSSALIAFLATRTAYDVGGETLDAFNRSVRVLYEHTGGRDCIVPGYGPVGAWEVLRSERYRGSRPNDLWLFDNYPHSCSGTLPRLPTAKESADVGGYGPWWGAALENRTDAISSSLWVAMVRMHLLGHPAHSLPAEIPLPALVATLAHDASRAEYRVLSDDRPTLAANADGTATFYLHADDGVLHPSRSTPTAFPATLNLTGQSREALDATCPTLSMDTPCGMKWGPSEWTKSAQKLISGLFRHTQWQTTLTTDLLVSGSATFEADLLIDLEEGAAAGLDLGLYYAPPDAPASFDGWFVTQGIASFDHAGAGGTRQVSISLDHRHITLRKGGRLRLVASNLAPNLVHHLPWVNPVMAPFSIGTRVGGGAAQAQPKLTIPTSSLLAAHPPVDTSPWEKGYWQSEP